MSFRRNFTEMSLSQHTSSNGYYITALLIRMHAFFMHNNSLEQITQDGQTFEKDLTKYIYFG